MSEKLYYFLSGFPRSGNTLLSSILNQNKNISVYANSIIPEIFFDLENKITMNEMVKNFPDYSSIENISKNIFKNYYSHLDSKYVIDRSSWSTNKNLEYLKKYCPNDIRIIFLYRDILEILASFIKWSLENDTFLNQFDTIEDRCHFLMRRDGPVMRHYLSIENLSKNKETVKYKFISYDEIVSDPNSTLNNIYNFLDIKFYQHNFLNIEDYSVNGIFYDDSVVGNNLHKVRNKIEKVRYNVDDCLPDKIISFYGNLKIGDLTES